MLRYPNSSDEQILTVTQRVSVGEREKAKLFPRKARKIHLRKGNHSFVCSPGSRQNDHEFHH